MGGLVLRFLEWAEDTYRKRGKITSEVHGYRAALKRVAKLYARTPAAEFTPEKLRTVQSELVRERKAVKTANKYVGMVARCWSWGAGRGLVPAATADALKHVGRLVPGRTAAKVYPKVPPAPDAHVEAVLRNRIHQELG